MADRLRGELTRLPLLAGAVVASVATAGAACWQGGFFADDFFNFRRAQVASLSLEHLAEPTSNHFAPAHKLGDWLFWHLFGLNYTTALVLLLIGFAATLLLFHRLLAELIRPGLAPILLTFLYGMAALHSSSLQWWSSGLDRVPATFLTFLAMLAYLRWFRTKSRAWLTVSVVSVVLGALFYVKPAFVPLYLILLRVLVLESDERVLTALGRAVREWWVWALYAVPLALFAVAYGRVYSDAGQLPSPSLGIFFRYLGILWLNVISLGTVGLYQAQPSSVTTAAAWAAQLLVVFGVAWTLVRSPRAWRPWTFFAVALLANAAATGLTRTVFLGPTVAAYKHFFNVETAWLLAIAAGIAFCGSRFASRDRNRDRPPPAVLSVPDRYRPHARALAGLFVATYAIASVVSAFDLTSPENWFGPRSRLYVQRVGTAIDDVRARQPDAALVDGIVPDYVVHPSAASYYSYSEVYPLIDDGVEFDASNRDLVGITRGGEARDVRFARHAGGDVAALLPAGAFSPLNTVPSMLEDRVCFRAGEDLAGVGVNAPMAAGQGTAFASVRYSSTTRHNALFAIKPDAESPVRTTRFAGFTPARDETRVFDLGADSFAQLFLILEPNSEVCFRSIEIGRLVPR
jgi:hypothetical protein